MRRTLVLPPCILAALALLLGCGTPEDGEDGPVRIDLPVVTACGDVPAGPHALTVRVNEASEIFVANRSGPISLLALKRHLIERQGALGDAGREPDGAPGWGNSKMDLILEADAAASWAVVGWIMRVASDPQLQVHRFHFRVRLHASDAGGAFAYIAPVAGPMSARVPFPDFEKEISIWMSDRGDGSHATQLLARLRKHPETHLSRGLFHVELNEESTTITLQSMLGVLDLLRRAGARQLTWLPAFPPPYRCQLDPSVAVPSGWEADLLAAERVWIAQNARPTRPVSIFIGGARLSAAPSAAALPRAKRVEGPYGWTEGTVFTWQPVSSDEDATPFEDGIGKDEDR